MPNIGPLELVIIVVIGIAILAVLVRAVRPSSQTPIARSQPPDLALAALRERYARGEIDATEFEERKRTLGG